MRIPTNLIVMALLAAPPALADDACEHVEEWVRAGPVALGDVHLERGALDFEGPRITGCLKNEGEGTLEQVMLEFESIREGRSGGGGFTTNLRLTGLAPGEATEFRTSQRRMRDLDHYERFGTLGYRFSGVNVLIDGQSGRPEFSTADALEIDRILHVDRPEHPLEAECAGIDADDGEGEIWISNARLENLEMPGTDHVIGCVTNRSDDMLADNRRHTVAVAWEGRAGDEPERLAMIGGTSRLTLTGPLEPGESGLFISNFDFDQPILEIEFYPYGTDRTGDMPRNVELGPRVKLERGN